MTSKEKYKKIGNVFINAQLQPEQKIFHSLDFGVLNLVTFISSVKL